MGLLKYRDVLADKGDVDYVNNILRVSVSLLYFLFCFIGRPTFFQKISLQELTLSFLCRVRVGKTKNEIFDILLTRSE